MARPIAFLGAATALRALIW